MAVDLAAILLIFGFVPLLAFAFVLVLVFGGRGRSRRSRQQDEEELRLMQQMNEGFMKLGDRVDALETLLMDRVERPSEKQSGRREL